MKKISFFLAIVLFLSSISTSVAIAKMDDCTFLVTIRVALMGDGATEAFKQKMHDAVDEHWNKGFKVGDCDCDFKVELISKIMDNCSGEIFSHPSSHCITIHNTRGVNRAFVTRNSWTKQLSDDYADTMSGSGRMEASDGKRIIAHEFGHLMDLPDEYTDKYRYFVKNRSTGAVISGPHDIDIDDWRTNGARMQADASSKGEQLAFVRCRYGFRVSIPNPGSSGSIMGDVANGKVLQRHIDSIFKRTTLKCPIECCCGNKKVDANLNEECDHTALPDGCQNREVCNKQCSCIQQEVSTGYVCGDGVLDPEEECDPMALPTGCTGDCTPFCTCVPAEDVETQYMEIINPLPGQVLTTEEPILVEYSNPAAIEQVQYEIDGLMVHQSDDPFEPYMIVPEMYDEGEHEILIRAYDIDFNPSYASMNFTIE
jgi:hypothetical protein